MKVQQIINIANIYRQNKRERIITMQIHKKKKNTKSLSPHKGRQTLIRQGREKLEKKKKKDF